MSERPSYPGAGRRLRTRRCCAPAICAAGEFRFAHGAEHALSGGRVLLDSYHCSRYNTQTRRLTAGMFEAIIERAVALADAGARRPR